MRCWWGTDARSALIDAVFAGADEDEGDEDEAQSQRVRGAAETAAVIVLQRGDGHGDDEQEARGTEGEADEVDRYLGALAERMTGYIAEQDVQEEPVQGYRGFAVRY